MIAIVDGSVLVWRAETTTGIGVYLYPVSSHLVSEMSIYFLWPSPLALHCGLLCQAPGTDRVQRTTVTVWRQLRALLERELGGHWDLYAVQMLPCTWRSFLVTTLKYRDSDDVQVEWITSA